MRGGSTDDAAAVIQWTCTGGPNQQWRLEPVASGAYRLVARHSGKALDVYGALIDDLAPAIQYPAHGRYEPAVDARAGLGRIHSSRRSSQRQGTRCRGRLGRRWCAGDSVHAARRRQPAVAPSRGHAITGDAVSEQLGQLQRSMEQHFLAASIMASAWRHV